MEQNKDALQIQEYALSQTSLEQVFIHFAREQLVEAQQREIQTRANVARVAGYNQAQ